MGELSSGRVEATLRCQVGIKISVCKTTALQNQSKFSEIAPEKAHKTLQWAVRHVTAVICTGNDIQAVQLTSFLVCPNLVSADDMEAYFAKRRAQTQQKLKAKS